MPVCGARSVSMTSRFTRASRALAARRKRKLALDRAVVAHQRVLVVEVDRRVAVARHEPDHVAGAVRAREPANLSVLVARLLICRPGMVLDRGHPGVGARGLPARVDDERLAALHAHHARDDEERVLEHRLDLRVARVHDAVRARLDLGRHAVLDREARRSGAGGRHRRDRDAVVLDEALGLGEPVVALACAGTPRVAILDPLAVALVTLEPREAQAFRLADRLYE